MIENELIGQKEEVLRNLREDYRIVSRDGESYIITSDWRRERLNIYIEHGVIVDVKNG